jgi:hypothetical protein
LVFGYFSLRGKSNRWLNFLPVGADSKSGATWVSQSVSRSVARAGTGHAIPAVALLRAFRSLAPRICAIFFCFGFLLQWELHCSIPGEKHKLVVVVVVAAAVAVTGRKEERKQPVAILQQQLQTDAAVFPKQTKQQFPCFLLQRRGVEAAPAPAPALILNMFLHGVAGSGLGGHHASN